MKFYLEATCVQSGTSALSWTPCVQWLLAYQSLGTPDSAPLPSFPFIASLLVLSPPPSSLWVPSLLDPYVNMLICRYLCREFLTLLSLLVQDAQKYSFPTIQGRKARPIPAWSLKPIPTLEDMGVWCSSLLPPFAPAKHFVMAGMEHCITKQEKDTVLAPDGSYNKLSLLLWYTNLFSLRSGRQ